jgi:hypothetical protein
MDRIVAKEKQTDKLRMNAQNATVFFFFSSSIISPPVDRELCGMYFLHQHLNKTSTKLLRFSLHHSQL